MFALSMEASEGGGLLVVNYDLDSCLFGYFSVFQHVKES
jgi:hypothetical protein